MFKSVKKLILGALLTLGLSSFANASILIEFEELNFRFAASGIFGQISDSGPAGVGDAVSTVRFFDVDDTTLISSLIGTLPNAQVDFLFDTTFISAPFGGFLGISQFFNISSGGFFLNIGPSVVAGLVGGGSVASISVTSGGIVSQSLPFGIVLEEPISFAINGQLTSASTVTLPFLGSFYTAFTAQGPGSVSAPGSVPEPAVLALMGLALLGLGLARRLSR